MWQSIKTFLFWLLIGSLFILGITIYALCCGGGNFFKSTDKATFTWDDATVQGTIKAATFTDKDTGQEYIMITTDKGGVSITPRIKK